ncbi:MAG TPA: hypothetical protein VGN57_12525 [Pirellulaceae bacterium]|jgi:hypothetical protein|nr:hypothetical protein [Pirellulaceae bacterium]
MEARLYRIAAAVAILASGFGAHAFAASVRTQNFIIQADTQEFAERTAQLAEQYRRDLALEWLGAELPPWREPCPIRVIFDRAAQGVTSFVFDGRGVPGRWSMEVLGPPDRILDAVLPHEITHTIFATHFGRPLPRWADEGACTTVEHESERIKHEKNLITYLKSDYGIAFNKMVAMKEYPRDQKAMLALYAQGYSVARYLILQGGRQKYVKFLEDGLAWNNWNAAVEKHYAFQDLSDLQVTWLEWVRVGSPMDVQPRASIAAIADNGAPRGGIVPPPAPSGEGLAPLPTGPSTLARPSDIALANAGNVSMSKGENGSDLSWYEATRQQRSRLRADPIPDNRRPQQSYGAAPNAVAGNALPPNLPPTQGQVQVLPPDAWSGPNGATPSAGVAAGPGILSADARPVPGTVAAPQPGLVPIDSAPAYPYGSANGSVLR